MAELEFDWPTDDRSDFFKQLERWRRNRIIRTIEGLEEVLSDLTTNDIFNHNKFARVRPMVGTQELWAEKVGVSQATIGNYERSVTYPNKQTRKKISDAIVHFRNEKKSLLSNPHMPSIEVSVDPVEAKHALDNSILNAAITDLSYDEETQQIITRPFASDDPKIELDQIEQDRKDLLESLSQQAAELAISLRDSNANVARLVTTLAGYSSETQKDRPNSRKLFRWGTNISRGSESEDIAFGIKEWDKISLEGFVSDHNELMRLYYREALAKAQQVDSEFVPEDANLPDSKSFSEMAEILETAVDSDGNQIFDADISTILRDIAREIDERKESEILTSDEEQRKVIRRRRIEAVKNGSILVGRVLFFASFLIVVDPMVALSTAGSIASIIGLMQNKSPKSVISYYDRLREVLPFLPRFPSDK
jgi:DNA-binding XRE family transcriptional regulator